MKQNNEIKITKILSYDDKNNIFTVEKITFLDGTLDHNVTKVGGFLGKHKIGDTIKIGLRLGVIPYILNDKIEIYNNKENKLVEDQKPHGLIVGILESKSIGNCSNRGTSSKYKNLVLLASEAKPNIPPIFDANNEEQYVIIKKKKSAGEDYFYAVKAFPTEQEKNLAGPMFGGCFIHTSDSRFPHNYPIPLHDRYECLN